MRRLRWLRDLDEVAVSMPDQHEDVLCIFESSSNLTGWSRSQIVFFSKAATLGGLSAVNDAGEDFQSGNVTIMLTKWRCTWMQYALSKRW